MPTSSSTPYATRRGVSVVIVTVICFALAAASRASDPWAPPPGYYAGVSGTGLALKNTLFDAMRTGHIQRRYGDFRQSAAIHDADPENPGRILLVYNRASVSAGWDQGATWNREHVWPQSRQPGSASNSTRGNLGDPHALRPANPSVNGSRSNDPFGLAGTTGPNRSVGAYYFTGDDDKGDIARSLFYSDTRWGPQLGLSLVDGFPSGYEMSDLFCLVSWHYLDPPNEFERRRNHTIFSQAENPAYYTNNRNAFVDLPGVVWSVYMDQENDARIYVGDAPGPDGGSSTDIVLETIVGAPAPGTTGVTISREGFDGVYFEVIPSGGAFSPHAGPHNAFPINQTGADATSIEVGLTGVSTAGPGLFSGQIVIDNLDVTTAGGAGRGGNDADDVIFIETRVLDRSEASFAGDSNLDVLEIDLGVIEQNAGDEIVEVEIFNLEQTPGLTAALDAEMGGASGDLAAIIVDGLPLDDVPGGGSEAVTITLLDDEIGEFSAAFTIRVFDDDDVAGAAEGATLAFVVYAEVVGSLCLGDLTGDSVVDAQDLSSLLAAWGGAAGDLNDDGVTEVRDLTALLGAWGPCPN